MKDKLKYIKNKILTDDHMSSVVEYMLSKAIAEGISTTVKFIYKKHKIIKNKRRYYAIYDLKTGIKLYNNIKYQDIAKYIVDNLDNQGNINHILYIDDNISRLKDKIIFLKTQLLTSSYPYNIEAKLDMTMGLYNQYKQDLMTILHKRNIC